METFSSEDFIREDPIQIPRLFQLKEDREISGFLTALISWGQRKSILRSAYRLMDLMDFAPFQFITKKHPKVWRKLGGFVHRTFNSDDLMFILAGLRYIYHEKGGLEDIFVYHLKRTGNLLDAISGVRAEFLKIPHLARSRKHLADPKAGSHAKRILLFLRWMIRRDVHQIDLGIWSRIPPSALYCPLDVHTGRAARALGLLNRKTDGRRAVEELTERLRILCPEDPVRYDIALFHLGRPENRVLLAHAPLFPSGDV
ncbi:MAG: TIGR02757 family protein [Flavobacteriales bacterium]|nr:TIGR02757 family protein [Flavobacteriales bacterium]MCX7767560.1 TIGR02757 family protein [Flavobacteriales bacterium]MDW8410080.1 TIGR02757 family protein [Flavobacteriales bacterium]